MQSNKPVVLVVDDDPVNLDILVQTLEQDYFLIIAKTANARWSSPGATGPI